MQDVEIPMQVLHSVIMRTGMGCYMTVQATGAQRVYATHGFQSAFSRYLNEQGIEAAEVKTAFGEEDEEVGSEEN
jgi:putative mRNA 3-end processing factor